MATENDTDDTTTTDSPRNCAYTFTRSDHPETTITDEWSCPHDAHEDSDYCLFHMPPDERDINGVTDRMVQDTLVTKLKTGDPNERVFYDAHVPALTISYVDVEGEDQHPVDLRHATITDGIVAQHSKFEETLDLRHATIGGFRAENCEFKEGILLADAVIDGDTDFFEALVTGADADFSRTEFNGLARFDEADFNDDVSFDGAVFNGEASFRGTLLYGTSNSIGDNTTFDRAVFHNGVSFYQARLEYTSFENTVFHGDTTFEKADVNGAVVFTGGLFQGTADFDEVTFNEDTTFEDATFEEEATFQGVEFNGGAALLDDDVSFHAAQFNSDVTFERGQFEFSNFDHTEFHGNAVFQRATFHDDANFTHAEFHGQGDFDEVLFDADADFSNVVFHDLAVFRGAEFYGGTNYMEDDAVFSEAVFGGDADFTSVLFTSANFIDAQFQGSVDFTDTEFSDSLHLRASSFGERTYFNFTDAAIADGTIIQPEDGWIRFDMTRATLGTVVLSAVNPSDERELLDYFRICDTTFDGFDFSAHTAYLDRNNWNLLTFNGGEHEYDFVLEMTPEIIEKTYLKAKNNASAQSNIKAAGEFRVKRQQYARKKFSDIATDPMEAGITRCRNALRAGENLFLGITCGYGLRLYRIAAVFLVFPLFAGFAFALGGPAFATSADQLTSLGQLATAGGLNTLLINIYFSYITFLTIGYGGIGPIGVGARFLAAALVYVNVILAGLFLYALIKRSEI